MADTLGDALPREIARVRDEVMPAYQDIGPAGYFVIGAMQADIAHANDAIAAGDIVAMARAYARLTEYTT